MENSKENNKVLAKKNHEFLDIMKIRGALASYLLSRLSKITNPEHISQYKLIKELNSNRVNDLLI